MTTFLFAVMKANTAIHDATKVATPEMATDRRLPDCHWRSSTSSISISISISEKD